MNRHVPSVATALMILMSAGCAGDVDESDAPGGSGAAEAPTFPLDADIWVAELGSVDGSVSIGAVREAIHRQGYDNQPFFTPDGSAFWFTALDEHSGQTDIFRWGFDGAFDQVTNSAPESEYSATPIPDGSGLSVIRVEADSTQRLWKIPFDGSEPTVILPDVAPVGYHAWAGPDTLALFVLGDPPTLQVADARTGSATIVAEGIGRSIRTIPGEHAVSFVRVPDDGPAMLTRWDTDGTLTPLVATIGGGDFHAWTPDGTVLMARGAEIHAWRPGEDDWTLIADLSEHNVRVTRLAVSPDGRHIAMVVEPGDVTL